MFAQNHAAIDNLAVNTVKPKAIIGAATVGGAFTTHRGGRGDEVGHVAHAASACTAAHKCEYYL